MYRSLANALTIALAIGAFTTNSSVLRAERGDRIANTCVWCHRRISAPPELVNRFLDWRQSRHAAAGVTCDKCHGGNVASSIAKQAHAKMSPPSRPDSRINPMNAPETCGGCHKAIVRSFVESEHYRVLKASEGGPSCTSCHAHMGSSVARTSFEGESLCTSCHNTLNGPLPQRPDIVKKAKSTLDTIARTNYTLLAIDELLARARTRKLNVAAEREDLRLLKVTLAEAKTGWHAFTPEGSALKSAKSFDDAVDIKQRLSKKVGL